MSSSKSVSLNVTCSRPQEHRPPSKDTCLSESEHHRSCSCSASSKSRLLDSNILSRIPWPAEAFDGPSTGNQAAPPRRQLLRESAAHYKCLPDLAAWLLACLEVRLALGRCAPTPGVDTGRSSAHHPSPSLTRRETLRRSRATAPPTDVMGIMYLMQTGP